MQPLERPDGIPGSRLSGPWPVGEYASALRDRFSSSISRATVFVPSPVMYGGVRREAHANRPPSTVRR